jgi:hypothetical protein
MKQERKFEWEMDLIFGRGKKGKMRVLAERRSLP